MVPDPHALFIDAFSRSWFEFNLFYAFPPFSIIMQCLQKVIVDKAKGTLLVPLWQTQAWFPKLMQMLISPPLVLPKKILQLPFKQTAAHQLQDNLHLLACQISGTTSETNEFQKSLSHSCALLGEIPQLNNMNSILKRGYISVLRGNIIDSVQYNEVAVVEFLSSLYYSGLSCSAINTARCALSTILINDTGITIGNSPLAKRIMKGIFELRPTSPRYDFIWDVNIVLKYLINIDGDDV